MTFAPIERSTAEMKASFPIQSLPPINGRPNLYELLRLLKQICRCSQTTKSGLGPLGYLFVALPPTHYMRYTSVPLILPTPAPETPNFPLSANQASREQVRIMWTNQKTENNNIENMNEALTALFLDAIPPTYKKYLENDLVGRTASNFWTIFETFLSKYGVVKPMDIENNNIRMKTAYDPALPIETLFSQIDDANEYAIFALSPLSDPMLVNAAEVCILRTGVFAQQYQEWRKMPLTQRTWANLKVFWQEAYDLREETETTSDKMGYTASADGSKELEETAAYDATVENFGTAFAANSTAFSNLTEANQTLGTNVSASVQDLQQQVQNLTQLLHNMAAVTNVQRPPTTLPTQNQQPAQFYQPPQQQPPPNYTAMTQHPQAQFNQNYRDFSKGGTRGGRGRSPGRHTSPGRQPFYGNNGRGGRNMNNRFGQRQQMNQPYSNNTKRYANNNYCWSHGHDVPDWHDSSTCPRPYQGHVWTATKQNTCQGCNRAVHKTLWPQQQAPNQY